MVTRAERHRRQDLDVVANRWGRTPRCAHAEPAPDFERGKALLPTRSPIFLVDETDLQRSARRPGKGLVEIAKKQTCVFDDPLRAFARQKVRSETKSIGHLFLDHAGGSSVDQPRRQRITSWRHDLDRELEPAAHARMMTQPPIGFDVALR